MTDHTSVAEEKLVVFKAGVSIANNVSAQEYFSKEFLDLYRAFSEHTTCVAWLGFAGVLSEVDHCLGGTVLGAL